MKITMIHGQNHKGSTCHIGQMLAQKIGGEVTEFFLPRDFSGYCTGCVACIVKDESLCAHHEQLQPIVQAMDEADVLILTSPVYVYHVTGQMKAFLDHCAYRWMMHRPEERMFSTQAVCISTAAGAGMKSTNKDMADSLFNLAAGLELLAQGAQFLCNGLYLAVHVLPPPFAAIQVFPLVRQGVYLRL